jgi:hypothetical protein
MAMRPRPQRRASYRAPAKTDGLCSGCRADLHRDCILHLNDDAVDAEDFIMVTCDCICQGECDSEHRLIDIIADLRREIEGREATWEETSKRSRASESALREVADLLDQSFNDEGVVNFSGRRKWDTFAKAAKIATMAAIASLDAMQASVDAHGQTPADADEDADDGEDEGSGVYEELRQVIFGAPAKSAERTLNFFGLESRPVDDWSNR